MKDLDHSLHVEVGDIFRCVYLRFSCAVPQASTRQDELDRTDHTDEEQMIYLPRKIYLVDLLRVGIGDLFSDLCT